MSEWLDFSVYATLNVTLWFVFPAWAARFTPLYLIDRNPEWVRTHTEQVRTLELQSRLSRRPAARGDSLSLGVLLVCFSSTHTRNSFRRFIDNSDSARGRR